MSLAPASGAESSSTADCPNHISWSRNLLNGFLSVVLHPFVPLMNCKFDYRCLFSKMSHCCARPSGQNSVLPIDHRAIASCRISKTDRISDYIRQWADNINILGINRQGVASNGIDKQAAIHKQLETSPIGSRTINSLSKYKYLNIAQLIFCNALLTYFLFKDLKMVSRYLRSRLARDDHND